MSIVAAPFPGAAAGGKDPGPVHHSLTNGEIFFGVRSPPAFVPPLLHRQYKAVPMAATVGGNWSPSRSTRICTRQTGEDHQYHPLFPPVKRGKARILIQQTAVKAFRQDRGDFSRPTPVGLALSGGTFSFTAASPINLLFHTLAPGLFLCQQSLDRFFDTALFNRLRSWRVSRTRPFCRLPRLITGKSKGLQLCRCSSCRSSTWLCPRLR